MSDPVLTLMLLAIFSVVVAAAWYFKTLDGDFVRAAASPIATGFVCGLVFLATSANDEWTTPAIIGVILTLAAIYVRHTGRESDPIDGMLLGSLYGAAAALPAAVWRADGPHLFSACVLAGSIAGCGITFASFHVTDRTRRFAIDLGSAAAAVAGAALPRALEHSGIAAREHAIGTAVVVPLIAVASVFFQSAANAHELAEESALGFIDGRDVRRAAHPFLRFRAGEWTDAQAWRELVRLAARIALRKRQQRARPGEIARLYQLEIIKLRMQLQEMARIGRPPANAGEDVRSDRMHA